ncbi:MAG: helix-turn-helix domain-containing protein [Actinobacteria bacterium]|nr:helix-turn-helix domain-containing protein [Actinomycetota bacterium]
MKLYSSKAWLRRRYVDEGKTAAEIAKMAGVTEMTITRWLDHHGLLRNKRSWRRE